MSAHDDYLDPDRAGLNDEHPDNEHIKEAFADYSGPGQLYRALYKYTDCGPSLGVRIRYWETLSAEEFDGYAGDREVSRWVYCDDLYKLGTWEDMDERGELIEAFCVSSIVEGVDYDTDTHTVSALIEDLLESDPADCLRTRLYAAVEAVDDEAKSIWNDTHGCDTCAQHWADDCGVELGVVLEDWDSVPVWKDCPDCEGCGTII